MIPASQYHKTLEKVPKRRNCLVVDDDDELIKDYTLLCKNITAYVHVEHTPQAKAAACAKGGAYDCIIVDNDSFKVGEYRGLETVKELVKNIAPEYIIYTSALPDDKMRTQASDIGVNFVEKGQWRKLEELVKKMFAKDDELLNPDSLKISGSSGFYAP